MNKKYLISLCLIFTLLFGAGALSVKAKTSISSLYDKIAEVAGTILAGNLSEMMAEEVVEEPINIGGIEDQYNFNMQHGDFADASTTILSMLNPFSASTTLEIAIVDIQGVATTSMAITCGTSTTAFGDSDNGGTSPGDSLMTFEVATSTPDTVVSGTYNAGTNSQERIEVGPAEYVLCHATGTVLSAGAWNLGGGGTVRGLTGDTNTFTGKYTLEWFNYPK